MAFNPNISSKKNPNEIKDSPFLTLSQRNKDGIASQNIFGNQGVDKTGATQGTNIFGMKEGGEVQDGTVFGEEEEKSCDEYFQEDENGEMNFDTNGFYDDALGLNFGNSAASNPMKASSSKDNSQELKNKEYELKTLLKDPDKNQQKIGQLKQQMEQMGGSPDTIIKDGLTKAGSTNATKTGTLSAAKQSTSADASSEETSTSTSTSGNTKTKTGSSVISSSPTLTPSINSASAADFMSYCKTTGIGGEVAIVPGRGTSSKTSSSSSNSSSFDWMSLGTNAASTATGSFAGGIATEGAKDAYNGVKNYFKDDKKGDEAETVEKAQERVDNAKNSEKAANAESKKADKDVKDAEKSKETAEKTSNDADAKADEAKSGQESADVNKTQADEAAEEAKRTSAEIFENKSNIEQQLTNEKETIQDKNGKDIPNPKYTELKAQLAKLEAEYEKAVAEEQAKEAEKEKAETAAKDAARALETSEIDADAAKRIEDSARIASVTAASTANDAKQDATAAKTETQDADNNLNKVKAGVAEKSDSEGSDGNKTQAKSKKK